MRITGVIASCLYLYTLNFLFYRQGGVAELISKGLHPLDHILSAGGVKSNCSCLFFALLDSFRLREVTFHFQFSCSESDLCSLSQHFRPIIWPQHPKLNGEIMRPQLCSQVQAVFVSTVFPTILCIDNCWILI